MASVDSVCAFLQSIACMHVWLVVTLLKNEIYIKDQDKVRSKGIIQQKKMETFVIFIGIHETVKFILHAARSQISVSV